MKRLLKKKMIIALLISNLLLFTYFVYIHYQLNQCPRPIMYSVIQGKHVYTYDGSLFVQISLRNSGHALEIRVLNKERLFSGTSLNPLHRLVLYGNFSYPEYLKNSKFYVDGKLANPIEANVTNTTFEVYVKENVYRLFYINVHNITKITLDGKTLRNATPDELKSIRKKYDELYNNRYKVSIILSISFTVLLFYVFFLVLRETTLSSVLRDQQHTTIKKPVGFIDRMLDILDKIVGIVIFGLLLFLITYLRNASYLIAVAFVVSLTFSILSPVTTLPYAVFRAVERITYNKLIGLIFGIFFVLFMIFYPEVGTIFTKDELISFAIAIVVSFAIALYFLKNDIRKMIKVFGLIVLLLSLFVSYRYAYTNFIYDGDPEDGIFELFITNLILNSIPLTIVFGKKWNLKSKVIIALIGLQLLIFMYFVYFINF